MTIRDDQDDAKALNTSFVPDDARDTRTSERFYSKGIERLTQEERDMNEHEDAKDRNTLPGDIGFAQRLRQEIQARKELQIGSNAPKSQVHMTPEQGARLHGDLNRKWLAKITYEHDGREYIRFPGKDTVINVRPVKVIEILGNRILGSMEKMENAYKGVFNKLPPIDHLFYVSFDPEGHHYRPFPDMSPEQAEAGLKAYREREWCIGYLLTKCCGFALQTEPPANLRREVSLDALMEAKGLVVGDIASLDKLT